MFRNLYDDLPKEGDMTSKAASQKLDKIDNGDAIASIAGTPTYADLKDAMLAYIKRKGRNGALYAGQLLIHEFGAAGLHDVDPSRWQELQDRFNQQ